MPKYIVNCEWMCHGHYEIDAKNEQKAKEAVYGFGSLPNGEYVSESFRVRKATLSPCESALDDLCEIHLPFKVAYLMDNIVTGPYTVRGKVIHMAWDDLKDLVQSNEQWQMIYKQRHDYVNERVKYLSGVIEVTLERKPEEEDGVDCECLSGGD